MEAARAGQKAITGTEADLRKLGMAEARERLLELGIKDAEIASARCRAQAPLPTACRTRLRACQASVCLATCLCDFGRASPNVQGVRSMTDVLQAQLTLLRCLALVASFVEQVPVATESVIPSLEQVN